MTEKCSSDLQARDSGVDSKYSGCTAVFVYLSGEYIYSASVGDSRAILGTTIPPSVMPAPTAVLGGEDRKMLEEVKSRRHSRPMLEIMPVQLTKDQKPEDPEELSRIISKGGRVQRLTDEKGKKIGPYRVWEMNSNSPGLAMSRSIGDSIGSSIGIIATPVCTKHKVHPYGDFFIVAGSDGIWDAMDNQDVVNFVECYREKCKRSASSPPIGEKVTIENTTISQLLCEEARIRWLTIVEEEDVMIDDISCIILELKPSQILASAHEKRPVPTNHIPSREIEEISAGNNNLGSTGNMSVRDPRRGSMVVIPSS